MDLESFELLLSPEGQALLADLADIPLRENDLLREVTRLRKSHPAALVSAAIETTQLRRRAAAKFSRAAQMYFTSEALEQATAEPVARHRAARLAGYGHIADLCCSIGGDALPLAERSSVLAVDRDQLRLAMLGANARAYGVDASISTLCADVTAVALPSETEALIFDPARRSDGRRRFVAADYLPPLETILRWELPAAVKVAPGIADEELLPGCEAEWVSLDGELREACLWLGAARTVEKRATLLPSGATLTSADPGPPPPLSAPQGWLYEPDPAVIRAGLVAQLAAQIDAAQIDQQIAYLVRDRRSATPFARSWRIEEWLPFNLKQLRRKLQERGVGNVTVKKRGSPITPEQLQRQLRLRGDAEAVVVLTRHHDAPIALICAPYEGDGSGDNG